MMRTCSAWVTASKVHASPDCTIACLRSGPVAQLAAVPLIMATAMIIEHLPRALRSRSTQVHTFGRTATDPHDEET